MKLLNGRELAGFIKERQAREVRALWQVARVRPRLAIVVTIDHPAINLYIRMKQRYGDDLGIDVEVHKFAQTDAPDVIGQLNQDASVHGIIVQLPLERPDETETIVNLVAPGKGRRCVGRAGGVRSSHANGHYVAAQRLQCGVARQARAAHWPRQVGGCTA